MKVLAIRGATTVTSNNKEEILKETSKLIETIILKNEKLSNSSRWTSRSR